MRLGNKTIIGNSNFNKRQISKLESLLKITKQIAKEKDWTKEQLETELNYLENQLNQLRLEQL